MQLIVKHEGYEPHKVNRVLTWPAAEQQSLEIRLQKIDPSTLRAISGRLLNHLGAAVPGAADPAVDIARGSSRPGRLCLQLADDREWLLGPLAALPAVSANDVRCRRPLRV